MSKSEEELGLTPSGGAEVTSPVPSCCSAVQHQSLGILMEDNIRMRQAMNNMLLTLTRWIRQNKEQTEHVRLLMQMLKESNEESEKERNVLRQNLEDMAMQMKVIEADLAVERQNRLLANREKDVAKQLIFKLQEENWGLRKARSRALISRDGSSYSSNGFPSPLSSSKFDCPR
ncbi:uncharacterized protein LOC130686868 [Daphnia carinata]|uniref:uncharacterized protein LOC130686868 n=1 Tax=Daphnia carinata TaxID=120202 RepID=UPI002580F951|nr:uncharacterized protein LOC130686868 [Daphnia carinata]